MRIVYQIQNKVIAAMVLFAGFAPAIIPRHSELFVNAKFYVSHTNSFLALVTAV